MAYRFDTAFPTSSLRLQTLEDADARSAALYGRTVDRRTLTLQGALRSTGIEMGQAETKETEVSRFNAAPTASSGREREWYNDLSPRLGATTICAVNAGRRGRGTRR